MKIWQILELPAAMAVGGVMAVTGFALATQPKYTDQEIFYGGYDAGYEHGVMETEANYPCHKNGLDVYIPETYGL